MNLDTCPPPPPPPPPPEVTSSRRLPFKSLHSQLKCQATKSAKDARRRRLELRRIRSFSQAANDRQIEGLPMERGRSHGEISVVGRRREMDDAIAVELGFLMRGRESYDFYGVFEGRLVARACCQMLHRMLTEIVEEDDDDEGSKKVIDWEEVMVEGLNEVETKMTENSAGAALIGSCAVVGDSEVVVAGSKVVLYRGGVAVQLLEDDDDDDDEKAKSTIEQVKVRVARRSDGDEFLILGSDGFWDVISDEEACQIARRCGGGAEAAAALLAEMAVAKGSKQNVSVLLVDFMRDGEIPIRIIG